MPQAVLVEKPKIEKNCKTRDVVHPVTFLQPLRACPHPACGDIGSRDAPRCKWSPNCFKNAQQTKPPATIVPVHLEHSSTGPTLATTFASAASYHPIQQHAGGGGGRARDPPARCHMSPLTILARSSTIHPPYADGGWTHIQQAPSPRPSVAHTSADSTRGAIFIALRTTWPIAIHF